MPTIISSDTIWKSGQTINMNGDIQIAHGVTLTIESGVTVNGNGHSIDAYGKLVSNGSSAERVVFNDVNFNFGIDYNQPGRIEIDYALITGGAFLPPTGNGSYGSFSLSNSIIINAASSYIWYPRADSIISQNVFINSGGLSIGTSTGPTGGGAVYVNDNAFVNSSSAIIGVSTIVVWASYGGSVKVSGNTFLSNISALEVVYSSGAISGDSNYFGTNDAGEIGRLILDRNTDLARPSIIAYQPAATHPSETVVLSLIAAGGVVSPALAQRGIILGTIGDDSLLGSAAGEMILGSSGSDSLFGGAGFDTVSGGEGSDWIDGGEHADLLYGGEGLDTILGGDGFDQIFGEGGDDMLDAGPSPDRVYGGDGNDLIYGGTNFGITVDGLFGEVGNDTIYGEGGYDLLDGGEGDDWLDGGDQADNLYGGIGNDTLLGGQGLDRLFGGAGDDLLEGGDGPDGHFGEQGNDTLRGGEGNDRFFGGTGNDLLEGGGGDDTLNATAGFDTLVGGEGNDVLYGRFNADIFVFEDGHGQDTIMDFAATNDLEKIDLSGVSAIVNTADLLANHATQVGADVLIDTGDENSILLVGVNLADLEVNDFLF